MTPKARVRPQRTTWTGPPTTESLAQARWGVARVLEHWEVAEDTIVEALTVVNELITNVVQHARTEWRLVMELSGRILRIAVDDDLVRPGARLMRPTAGQVSGLQLVNILTQRWGWYERDTGKTIWAELLV